MPMGSNVLPASVVQPTGLEGTMTRVARVASLVAMLVLVVAAGPAHAGGWQGGGWHGGGWQGGGHGGGWNGGWHGGGWNGGWHGGGWHGGTTVVVGVGPGPGFWWGPPFGYWAVPYY